ncbi:MAG: hypothetical protein JSV05_01890 [Candidatus Bathyarchaeota archaeon]|nr:MAG: hypothetical protein JSV05_01890 [Candidatus Bathyarchaeota archaeon]
MRVRLLHGILAGAILASVFGFYLIPEVWQLLSREPTFEPPITGMTILGLTASVAVIAITLLSFKLVRRMEQ